MLSTIQKPYKLLALTLFVLTMGFVFAGEARAATINVAAGSDETTTNASCSLSEAITNINDQAASSPDCAAGDGIDDTIALPAGTITLTANLPVMSEPVAMQGEGMGVSVIDGGGLWSAINSDAEFTGTGFTLTASVDFGFLLNGGAQLDKIEVDGTGWEAPNGSAGGIITANSSSADVTVAAMNIYVHGFNVDAIQMVGVGLSGGSTNNVTATLTNVTISDITNTGTVQSLAAIAGLFDGGASSGGVDATIRNATVTDITSSDDIVIGLLTAGSTLGSQTLDSRIENSTFTNLNGGGSNQFLAFNNGAVIGAAGSAVNSIVTNVTTGNLLIANNNIPNCGTASLNGLYAVSGTVTSNIVSIGGNVSDGSTCSSYFNHTSDQLGLSGLGATLGALSDNGGYVPTIPLVEGSPAVDSGLALAGLSTDARLAARPQGNAYDSGAYESPYTRVEPEEPANTLADSGKRNIGYVMMFAWFLIMSVLLSRRPIIKALM